MPEAPFIPLSWLREQRAWARTFFRNGDTLNEHDLWLFNVRLEMQRRLIQELREKVSQLQTDNNVLLGKLFAMNEGYIPPKDEYTVYDYGYDE